MLDCIKSSEFGSDNSLIIVNMFRIHRAASSGLQYMEDVSINSLLTVILRERNDFCITDNSFCNIE